MAETASPHSHRHVFLAIWLWFIIIINIIGSILYFLMADIFAEKINLPAGLSYLMGIFGLCNCVAAIALWKWKKWGFWLYVIATIVGTIIICVYLNSLSSIITSVISILILYWALQVGKENKAWKYLK